MRFTALAVSPIFRLLRVPACSFSIAALCVLLQASAASAATTTRGVALSSTLSSSRLNVSAAVNQCITAEAQEERSATFMGEMSAIPGATKMEMRIGVLEWGSLEADYHTVSAPGLGVWLSAAPGVKVYRNFERVTNLTAPAFYRGVVRFRWLNAKGRLIASTELHTHRCEQPAPASTTTTPGMSLE
jgi:hypothetical protein